jgi:hypothetical protein
MDTEGAGTEVAVDSGKYRSDVINHVKASEPSPGERTRAVPPCWQVRDPNRPCQEPSVWTLSRAFDPLLLWPSGTVHQPAYSVVERQSGALSVWRRGETIYPLAHSPTGSHPVRSTRHIFSTLADSRSYCPEKSRVWPGNRRCSHGDVSTGSLRPQSPLHPAGKWHHEL